MTNVKDIPQPAQSTAAATPQAGVDELFAALAAAFAAYGTPQDAAKIEAAFAFARDAHGAQKRV